MDAFKGYEEALVVGPEKNFDVLRTVARQHAVPCIIPPQDRFKDEWFQGNCPLTPEGEEVKAQIIFEELEKHPQFLKARIATGASTH